MRYFTKGFTWLYLLSKRLYKKPTFLAILLLIPVLVFGYTASAKEDSGMLTIALVQEAPDTLGRQVFTKLQEDTQLLNFVICPSVREAKAQLVSGKLDAVWVFSDELEAELMAFAADPDPDNAVVTVMERESNITLQLSREKLGEVLFPILSEAVYIRQFREFYPETETLTDEELLAYYAQTVPFDQLFVYDNIHAGGGQEAHYLLSPVRGLLGVVILLSALAASMYYIRDTETGTFSWVPDHRRPVAELGCQVVTVLHIALAALLCLTVAGHSTAFGIELGVTLLYALCCSGFAMVLRRLCRSLGSLACMLPVLIVVLLVVCPVFFDLGVLRPVQYLLPPTYYINAVYNPIYILIMAVYCLVCFGICALADRQSR